MRTTIRIDGQLLAEARETARQSGRTLSEFIEDALRQTLALRRKDAKASKRQLTTDDGNGLQPGVCLDDNAKLLDVMER